MSVVLPCRNVAETIEDQLRSLSLSDYRGAWEVIVVDNCSTDSTAAQAERWSKHLPLRVISATGAAGINTARNAGAKEARGELLLFCDGDDEVATDWVQTLTTAALGYDLVGGRLDEVRLNRGRGPRRPSHPIGQLPVAGNYLPFAPGANLGIWADVLRALKGFDEAFRYGSDDVDLAFRANQAGFSLGYAANAVVAYRHREGSRALFQQFVAYGRAEPLLYRRHRSAGMPPSGLAGVVRRWLLVGVTAAVSWRDPQRHGDWLARSGISVGRMWGSIHERTLYL